MDKVYIVILNYNGWRDTQECLESVLKLDYPNYQVIVVDNFSSDQSIRHLLAWAEGDEEATVDNKDLAGLSTPPCLKPVPYVLYEKDEIFTSQCHKKENGLVNPIVFIRENQNRGFSAGNNAGIAYALQRGDFQYIWLLNNDTVCDPAALKTLVDSANSRNLGISGSGRMQKLSATQSLN